jgi:hypothetical protein
MTIVQFIEKWRANARIFSAGNDCSATAGEAITELLDELDTLQAERPTTPVEDDWALARVRRMAETARTNAGVYGAKLLKGHGYPDEVMRDAQDALALEEILARLAPTVEAERPTVEQLTTGFVWITCPDCGERCQLGTMHHCRYRGAVQVPPRK